MLFQTETHQKSGTLSNHLGKRYLAAINIAHRMHLLFSEAIKEKAFFLTTKFSAPRKTPANPAKGKPLPYKQRFLKYAKAGQ
ncbi:MAG: hypothetical protein PHT34_03465 [Oscillospiraceae bacterium]|nr:hypothetical protein [Oscillospiraceae bacterium]